MLYLDLLTGICVCGQKFDEYESAVSCSSEFSR